MRNTICWFTENYPPNSGGMSQSADRIVQELRKTCTVHVFHFTNKIAPFFTEANVGGSYTSIPVYLDSSHTLNVLWSHIELHPLITTDTILVSYGSQLCQRGLPLIAKWLNLPLVTCFRGNDFDSGIFSSKKQHILYAIEHSAAVACVTKEKQERILSLNLNTNIYFTPNAIDLEQWDPLESDIKLSETYRNSAISKKYRLGFIGYQKPKKGISFFLEALQLSNMRDSVFLQFVGEISPDLAESLALQNIPYSLVLPNSKTELMAYYLSCDVIVIPSIYDGMPNVLFEAGALKIPIIASKAGGLNDVLTNENAYVFETISQASLLNTLDNFNEDSLTTKQQKAEELYTTIETNYTPTLEIKNYLNIFKNINNKL